MNIFNFEYKEILLDTCNDLTSNKVVFIGDREDSSCDICINLNNPSDSIDVIIEQIKKNDINAEIYINSVLGIGKSFTETSDCIWNYVNFFCLLFKRLIVLNKKINFLQIGFIDSSVVSIFEGIAFNAELECDNLKSKTLRIDRKESIPEYTNRIWLQNSKSLLVLNDKVYKKAFSRIEKLDKPIKNFFNHAGIYVITGGNGGIGHILAKWLVTKYQARVILIGRHELNKEQQLKIKNIGVSAYITADVSNYSELEEAFKHIKDYYGHIDTVFHLAGTIKDKLLRNYDSQDVNSVISPKIYGVINLFKISKKIKFGNVCLFSSLSGIIGNIGQAVYSAANAFMDDFCSYLRNIEQNKNWFSINWGAWNADGMQMKIESADIESMQSEECLNILEYILNNNIGRTVVWNGNPNLLEEKSNEEIKVFSQQSNNSLKNFIQDWVFSCVKKFSGFSNIDFDQSIIELGIDSVNLINIAVSFENEIRKYIPEYKLSKALLFEYFSVNKIVSFFVESLPEQVIEKIVNDIYPAKRQDETISNALMKSTNEMELHYKDDSLQEDYNGEDIAIVGIAGEFPNASNLSEFEKLLFDGTCTVRSIPENRWNWKKYYSQDKLNKNSSYCRHGGFLKNAEGFDNSFFRITSSESIKMDPQERKFLQVTYHALEDGGYFSDINKNIGVFVAAMFNHYQNLDNENLPIVSNSFASIANRVSFFMDLNGPSVCVDSMCSGSLTALNLAINSINLGECTSAIVGGVNIMPHPGKYIALSQAGFLSSTGKCQSFGIGADGYVPGEGIISIFIKKLSKAIADGNKIYGIIKGIAVNSVGASSGYTVPSISAQVDVIKKALKKAAVKAEDVTYIETHGTGTSLGDPIEIEGIKSAYGSESSLSSKKNICWLGAVKSNIGHLESAAGLAGLIKILLQFKNKKIYPSLFSSIENKELFLEKSRFKIAKSNIDWNGKYAGLSAFGAGGSNVHVIIQRYDNKLNTKNVLESYPIPLSAKTDNALKKRISDLLFFIKNSDYDLYSLSYTLCCARQHFEKRICYLVKSKEELLNLLRSESNSKNSENVLVRKYLNNKFVDFSALFHNKSIQQLPLYPFEENKYWIDFSKIDNEDNYKSTLLVPYYLDAGKISSETNIITKVYINAIITNSDGYFIVDRKYDNSKQKKDNVFVIDYKNHKDWQYIFENLKNKPNLRIIIQNPIKENSYYDILHSYYALAKVIIEQNIPIEIIILALSKPNNEVTKIQHSIYGLFRSISLEKSHISTIMLEKDDFDQNDLVLIGGLSRYILKNQKFMRLCIANHRILRLCFKEVTLLPTSPRLKSRGVYLITGGMGNIGLFIAKFLRKKYDARLVLLGRSDIPENDIKKAFANLYDSNCIKYIPTNIEYIEQVQKAVKLALKSFGTINGIIHSAAQIHDSLFADKNENEFFSTISVKVKGVENIDICTKNIALDFFACFSSLVTVTGNVGQSDYMIANNYLDIFAKIRNEQVRNNQRKGHTISINWPLWVNYATNYSSLKNYLKESFGIEILSETLGQKLFEQIINNVSDNINQIVPLSGEILSDRFLEYAGYSVDETILNSQSQVKNVASKNVNVKLDNIVSIINQVTNEKLNIDPDVSFGEIGMNSIMMQELAKKIEDTYAFPMPVLVLFKYNSVNKLIDYLNKKLDKNLDNTVSDIQEKNHTPQDNRIVIIGISGKMPNADNLDEYWNNLIENKNAITPITRWKDRKYYGGLINDYDSFDYRFFNISPLEASLLDPQQRLFLENSYNAIVDSGYRPSELTQVGVFVGAQFNDYRNLLKNSNVSHHPFVSIGNSNNMIANRVSYFFNFSGPSQMIDTACSSAIVAIHSAVDSLLSRECNYCLAGAVSLMLDPDTTDGAISMGILSSNYRCATFDESADGYVRSEGIGCVLLKRYNEAIADGDSIYGVIESISEGHGGHSNSITAPNQEAQTDLIVSAYKGDLAKRVSYIETHGTGTKLGDPIEIEALKVAWEKLNANNPNHPVYLGAVKSSIGHLEPASGIASLFKILLAMKHKQIPANQNFYKQNKLIDLQGTNFELVTKNILWNDKKGLVAGMSCFGFGGSNTHMVLSEHKVIESNDNFLSAINLFTLSAKTKNSLQKMLDKLISYLSSKESIKYSLNDISFTLNAGRDHFQYRLAVTANNKEELLQKLKILTKSDFKKVNVRNEDFPEKGFKDIFDLQNAYLSGANIDWKSFYNNKKYHRLHLPGYIFEKTRCWFKEQDKNE